MTHVYRAVWWLPHPFSLSSLFLFLSLSLSPFFWHSHPLFFFLSRLHPHIFLPDSCACLPFVATELNRVAQTPTGFRAILYTRRSLPLLPSRSWATKFTWSEGKTWGQAIPRLANTWASKFPAPKGNDVRCRVRSAQIGKIFPKAGVCDCPCDWFISTPELSIRNHIWCAIESRRGNYSEITSLPPSDTKRVLQDAGIVLAKLQGKGMQMTTVLRLATCYFGNIFTARMSS